MPSICSSVVFFSPLRGTLPVDGAAFCCSWLEMKFDFEAFAWWFVSTISTSSVTVERDCTCTHYKLGMALGTTKVVLWSR